LNPKALRLPSICTEIRLHTFTSLMLRQPIFVQYTHRRMIPHHEQPISYPCAYVCTPRALPPEWSTLYCFDSSLYSPRPVGTATRFIRIYSGFHVAMQSDIEYFPASQVHPSSVLKPRTDRVQNPLGPIRRNLCSIQWEGCLTWPHPHPQSFHWLCLFGYGLPRMVEHTWMA
jgi:hypothetical protein